MVMAVKSYQATKVAETPPTTKRVESKTDKEKIQSLEVELRIRNLIEENEMIERQNKEMLDKIDRDKARIFKRISTAEMLQMGAVIDDNMEKLSKNNAELSGLLKSGMRDR